MDRLVELVSQHRFSRNGYRTNVDQREENRVKDRSGRLWLKRGPYSNTVREGHPIVEHVNSMGALRRRVPEQAPGRQRHPACGIPPGREKYRSFLDRVLGVPGGGGCLDP